MTGNRGVAVIREDTVIKGEIRNCNQIEIYGYVEGDLARPDTALQALVRGKPQPVRVAKLPFVAHRYHRG